MRDAAILTGSNQGTLVQSEHERSAGLTGGPARKLSHLRTREPRRRATVPGPIAGVGLVGWFLGRAVPHGREGLVQRAGRALGEYAKNTHQNECSFAWFRKASKLSLHACNMRPVDGKAVPHMGVDRVATRTYYLRSARQGPTGARATGSEGR